MGPSGDGDVEKKDPPTFKAPKKLKAKGATEADLAEVDGILEYNKLFFYKWQNLLLRGQIFSAMPDFPQ